MILTSNGLILTNNHVVEDAATLSVRDVATNATYVGNVVGYDLSEDVAVIQLENASGLATIKTANSNDVTKGEDIVGIGNAGGVGGTPSFVAGNVVALNQAITAGDETNPAGSEHLSGLIEVNAAIEPGDSGGPLVNENGKVVGIRLFGVRPDTLLGSLVDRLRAYGFEVREVPFAAWVSELVRYAANHPSHPMTTFLPLFIDRDQETGLTPAEMYFEHVFPHYSRTNTERALSGSGIAFTSVDAPLLDANIGRLISVGYLKAPRDNLLPGQLPAQLPDQLAAQLPDQLPGQRERSQVPNRSAHAG